MGYILQVKKVTRHIKKLFEMYHSISELYQALGILQHSKYSYINKHNRV